MAYAPLKRSHILLSFDCSDWLHSTDRREDVIQKVSISVHHPEGVALLLLMYIKLKR